MSSRGHKLGVPHSENARRNMCLSKLKFYKEHPDCKNKYNSILTKELLEEEYVNKRKSTRQIGRELDISASTIGIYVRKYDLKIPRYISDFIIDSERQFRKLWKLHKLPKICINCGLYKESGLHIHHIDRNQMNNSLDNIQILCTSCHALVHWGKVDGSIID